MSRELLEKEYTVLLSAEENIIQCLTFFFFILFYFIFKLYIIVLVLPNIKMNPPQKFRDTFRTASKSTIWGSDHFGRFFDSFYLAD